MKNKKISKSVSIVLGVFMILYAANQFLHLLPTSYGNMPDFTRNYLDAVAAFLPALYIFEIMVGLMLIFNKWVPFISILLAPLSINFLIFNFTNGDWNIIPALFVAILNIILLFLHKEKFKPLFS
jgi:putative oxidoreductase